VHIPQPVPVASLLVVSFMRKSKCIIEHKIREPKMHHIIRHLIRNKLKTTNSPKKKMLGI